MKGKERTGRDDDNGDRAQLILIAGLLVAVAVVGIAIVIGGGLFSESTTGDRGVSSLSAQMTDQVGTAEEVSQEDVSFVNRDSAKLDGRDHVEVCGKMVNTTKAQKRISDRLAEGEVILDIGISGDCDGNFQGNRSWLTGQTNVANLPAVNVTEVVTTEVNEVCGDGSSGQLHDKTDYPSHTDQFISELKAVYSPNNVPEDPAVDKMVQALDSAPDIKLSNLPDGIDASQYVEKCIEVEINEGRLAADIVFAIDSTGSMGDPSVYSGDYLIEDWQEPVHSEYPPVDLANKYRPETTVPVRDNWIEFEGVSVWSGSSNPGEGVGDVVRYCSGTYYVSDYCSGYKVTVEVTGDAGTDIYGNQEWDVETSSGTTGTVDEDTLYNMRFRLEAPERMWFTQKGLMAAVDDLNRTEPDRAGLLEYDANTGGCTACPDTEHAAVVGVNDDSHREKMKEKTAKFKPGGGTNIANGLDEARSILERDYGSGPEASTTATKNVVLMTDGRHNEGAYSDGEAHELVEDNPGDYEDIFLHSIILGDTAADDEEAIEDMGRIANDPDPDLSDSDADEDQLPDWEAINDENRPNGTLIASDDPSKAEDIFDDIIGSIEDETEFEEPNSSTTDPDIEVNATRTSKSGVVGDIYDFRMNVTNFTSNGTYRAAFVDTDPSGNQVVAWEMVVNNTFVYGNTTTPNIGYKVEFSSDTKPKLNETLTVSGPNPDNLSTSPDEYVWVDLAGKDENKPRFEMASSNDGFDDYSDSTEYMKDAWGEVQKQMDSGGVAIVTEETNPFGQVNGTFSLDFRPLFGDFSRVDNLAGGGFEDDCEPSGAPDDELIKCGWQDPGNDRNAVSTAQIRDLKLFVTVEGPGGVSEKEITVEDAVDLYEEVDPD